MNKLFVFLAMALGVAGFAGVAGASAPPDPLIGTGGAVDTIQDQLISYAAPIGAALVAVGLAFVAVKLIPKVIRLVGSKLG